jgi:proteic killer suppression protein
VILSFQSADTERLFRDERVRQWQTIENIARRKLDMLHAARRLEDLKVPPGNRLHKLVGDREGQHAISINGQYRVCFAWRDGNAYDVEITDYH